MRGKRAKDDLYAKNVIAQKDGHESQFAEALGIEATAPTKDTKAEEQAAKGKEPSSPNVVFSAFPYGIETPLSLPASCGKSVIHLTTGGAPADAVLCGGIARSADSLPTIDCRICYQPTNVYSALECGERTSRSNAPQRAAAPGASRPRRPPCPPPPPPTRHPPATQHAFCNSCYSTFLGCRINDNAFFALCPEINCYHVISQPLVFSLVEPGEGLARYEKLLGC